MPKDPRKAGSDSLRQSTWSLVPWKVTFECSPLLPALGRACAGSAPEPPTWWPQACLVRSMGVLPSLCGLGVNTAPGPGWLLSPSVCCCHYSEQAVHIITASSRCSFSIAGQPRLACGRLSAQMFPEPAVHTALVPPGQMGTS